MADSTPAVAPKKSYWRRLLNLTFKRLSKSVDHQEVVEHIVSEGALSGRYLFMVFMSCAIATLGLLLSSPAVIIGAMLISPLMGPIMLMGFSLGTVRLNQLEAALPRY